LPPVAVDSIGGFLSWPPIPKFWIMLNLFNRAHVFTLTGGHVNRVQQVLRVAEYQIALAQNEASDYRMEEAEAAIATARGLVVDAIDAARAEKEASSEAERERPAWLPLYRAA
jgi:hypothetical protein